MDSVRAVASAVVSEPAVYFGGSLSMAVLASYYALVSHYLAEKLSGSRQKAWILTFASAVTMSVVTVPFIMDFATHGWTAERLKKISLVGSESVGDSQEKQLLELSIWASTFFMAYLALDLGIGWFHYRSEIDFTTGWVHHIGYFCLLLVLIYHKLTPVFCTMCVLEIPTIFLSLGHLHKPFRNDVLFGTTFFSARIIFHAYMIYEVFRVYDGPWWMILLVIYPMHVLWFRGFVIQQIKRLSVKKKGQNLAASDSAFVAQSKAVTTAGVRAKLRNASGRIWMKMTTTSLRKRH